MTGPPLRSMTLQPRFGPSLSLLLIPVLVLGLGGVLFVSAAGASPLSQATATRHGAVLQGPAKEPLRPLRVEALKDGRLRLFTQEQADI